MYSFFHSFIFSYLIECFGMRWWMVMLWNALDDDYGPGVLRVGHDGYEI
jgi:hypothetical protein